MSGVKTMMHGTVLLAGTSLATSLVLVVGTASSALADSCVDLRTGQTWDCKGPAPQVAPGQPAPAPSQLRELLRKRLSEKAAPSTDAAQARWADAANRAMQATDSARLTSDPQEQAQFKAKYAAAMRDLNQAGNDMVAGTSDPAERARMQSLLASSQGALAQQAAAAGLGSGQAPAALGSATPVPPPQQQAAQPARPGNVFSVCEDPKNGVTTCYEMGRTGNDCLEVLYQGGQRTYENGHKTCSAEDMRQRDAYFAGQPVGQGAPADPRSQQLAGLMASLSPQCQEDLKSYLYNSRASQTSAAAGDKAMQSFSNINSNRDCKSGFERLASILGVETPQRHLSNGARSAWASGMAEKPRATVNVPDVHEAPTASAPTARGTPQGTYAYEPDNGGGFNVGEVLNTGVQVLGTLATLGLAILGGFAEGYGGGYSSGPVYTSHPTYNYGGPSGNGYVYRGNSGGSNSTITGIGRH